MPSRKIDLKYPIRGMSETYGFSYAEELTSRDEQNMRSIDPSNGRIRGAQRAGLGLYAGGDMAVTDKKIKALAATHTNKVQLDYAEDLTPAITGANSPYTFSPVSPVVDMVQDEYGSFYCLTQGGSVEVFNEDASAVRTINSIKLPAEALLPPTDAMGSCAQQPPVATSLAVDKYMNVYIGTGAGEKTLPRWCGVYCFALMEDDTYELAWTSHLNAYVIDMAFHGNDLYVLSADKQTRTEKRNTDDSYADHTGGYLEILKCSCTYATGGSTHTLTLQDKVDWGALPAVDDVLLVTVGADTREGVIKSITSKVVAFDDTLGAISAGTAETTIRWQPMTGVTTRVHRYPDVYPGSAEEGDLEETLAPVIVGDSFVEFSESAKSITYVGEEEMWPGGCIPRAGDKLVVKNSRTTSGPTNNGTFTVEHASNKVIYVAETVVDEDKYDHQEWGTNSYRKGWSRRTFRNQKGRFATKTPGQGSFDSWIYTEKFSPRIYVKNPGYSYTTPAPGNEGADFTQFYGRIAFDDKQRIYITRSIYGLGAVFESGVTAGWIGEQCKVNLIACLPMPGTLATATEALVEQEEGWATGNNASATTSGLELVMGPEVDNLPTVYVLGRSLTAGATYKDGIRRCKVYIDEPAAGLSEPSFETDTSWADDGYVDLGAFAFASATVDANRIRVAKDSAGTLYLPWTRNGSAADGSGTYGTDTDIIAITEDYTTDGGGAGSIKKFAFANIGSDAYSSGPTRSVSIPASGLPDYSGSAAAPTTVPTVMVGANKATGGDDEGASLYKADLATITQTVQSPRDLTVLALANDTFKRVLSGSFGSVTTDGGTHAVDATAPYVQMVAAFGKIYITDGANYFEYDPATGTGGTVSDYVSTGYGGIPKHCRLVEVWRGRVVFARDPEDPEAWHMSRVSDPNNWDNFPQNPSTADAISARNSKAGAVPGVVNTVIPYSDDLCIFGCDDSIWQLTGDPRAGGQLDLITDSSGISFGRPWCKDSVGTCYFVGAEGGLYSMSPTQGLTNLSAGRVGRQLQNIDLVANYVNLVWNYLEEGVHIFVIPFADYGSSGYGDIKEHWFYDARNGAFHKDQFGNATDDNVQPTAAIQVNGDLFNDRVVMLGGPDGRVRRWGRDSSGNLPNDDQQTSTTATVAIDSYVTAGPLVPVSAAEATQLSEFVAVLGDAQDGCNYEFFSADNPEVLGAAKATGSLHDGRNLSKLVRVSGDNIFMRLRNASQGQRWAYESGLITMTTAGSKR
jgi:hypothetical protein